MHAPSFRTSCTSFRRRAVKRPRALGRAGLVDALNSEVKARWGAWGFMAMGRGMGRGKVAARVWLDRPLDPSSADASKSTGSTKDICCGARGQVDVRAPGPRGLKYLSEMPALCGAPGSSGSSSTPGLDSSGGASTAASGAVDIQSDERPSKSAGACGSDSPGRCGEERRGAAMGAKDWMGGSAVDPAG